MRYKKNKAPAQIAVNAIIKGGAEMCARIIPAAVLQDKGTALFGSSTPTSQDQRYWYAF